MHDVMISDLSEMDRKCRGWVCDAGYKGINSGLIWLALHTPGVSSCRIAIELLMGMFILTVDRCRVPHLGYMSPNPNIYPSLRFWDAKKE